MLTLDHWIVVAAEYYARPETSFLVGTGEKSTHILASVISEGSKFLGGTVMGISASTARALERQGVPILSGADITQAVVGIIGLIAHQRLERVLGAASPHPVAKPALIQ